MRIALVILHANPARGGAERYTLDLAVALARRGHEASLLATTFANDIPSDIKTIPLTAPGPTRTRRYLRMLGSLDAHLAQSKYDIVHAMLPVRRCDIYHPHAGLAVAARMSRLKRWLNPRRARYAAVEHQLLTAPNAPTVLCLSEYVKRDVQKHYTLEGAKLPILFNAVDLTHFTPAPRPERSEAKPGDPQPQSSVLSPQHSTPRPIALMVAQDYLRKGLRQTLEAIASIEPANRPQLIVVGKGDTAPYKRLARALRVDNTTRFEGPTTEPRPYYQSADFFVLPTRHDPCSLVVLEALAMGLPVISTSSNGATEIMTDRLHGRVLTDPSDVRALASAIQELSDPQTRHRMSDACLALRPQLAYDRHIDRLLEIYSQRLTIERSGH